jgi:hypothetical protein
LKTDFIYFFLPGFPDRHFLDACVSTEDEDFADLEEEDENAAKPKTTGENSYLKTCLGALLAFGLSKQVECLVKILKY